MTFHEQQSARKGFLSGAQDSQPRFLVNVAAARFQNILRRQIYVWISYVINHHQLYARGHFFHNKFFEACLCRPSRLEIWSGAIW